MVEDDVTDDDVIGRQQIIEAIRVASRGSSSSSKNNNSNKGAGSIGTGRIQQTPPGYAKNNLVPTITLPPTPTSMTSSIPPSSSSRKEKEYCTYWVFHGECAFIHSPKGCRFKHEMPRDAKTMAEVGLKNLPKWWIDRQRFLFKPRGGGGGGGHISADWRRVTPDSDAVVTTTDTDTLNITGPCTIAGSRAVGGTPTTVGIGMAPSALGTFGAISPPSLLMTPTATMPRIRGRGIIGRVIGLSNGDGVSSLGNSPGNGDGNSSGSGKGNNTGNENGSNVIGSSNANGHGFGNRLTMHDRSTVQRHDDYSRPNDTMFDFSGITISNPDLNSTTSKAGVRTFRRAAGGVGGVGGSGGNGGVGEMGQTSLFDNLIDLGAE